MTNHGRASGVSIFEHRDRSAFVAGEQFKKINLLFDSWRRSWIAIPGLEPGGCVSVARHDLFDRRDKLGSTIEQWGPEVDVVEHLGLGG